ncbi:MAG: hypothetical protein COA79_22350 [Planctomycetota bacterium]|nr:MAG: hypothetical protein COA79_22350 [Planctomycetota bacterium]
MKNDDLIFDNSKEINSLPPILSPKQTADLLQVSIHTIYRWSSLGKLDYCSCRKGKHLFINKARLLTEMFTEAFQSKG